MKILYKKAGETMILSPDDAQTKFRIEPCFDGAFYFRILMEEGEATTILYEDAAVTIREDVQFRKLRGALDELLAEIERAARHQLVVIPLLVSDILQAHPDVFCAVEPAKEIDPSDEQTEVMFRELMDGFSALRKKIQHMETKLDHTIELLVNFDD